MVQIVKKKGRPSKADLARRVSVSPASGPVVRRSHRQRNVRYNIDYDDYLEDDYDDEEEDEILQKKLKLVVKLNQGGEEAEPELSGAPAESRGTHALDDDHSPSEEDDSEKKPLKKRRIDRVNEGEKEDDENGADTEDEDEDYLEVRRRTKVGSKGSDSVSGTPSDSQSGIQLPDKKTLELILDKLQKKDIYGVYAEPVDPEELSDYHGVIEHPMDFSTVRKKLASGAYSTLEHFATDVFLICSNAMQYNAPETIYYKQAHTIQELGKKKFERLRVDYECSEKEQKTKSSYLVKKHMKKLPDQISQEPIGSDFSSGPTLATAGDVKKGSFPAQAGSYEKNSNIDGHIEANSSLFDKNLEKSDELFSGKGGFLSRLGRKTVLLDKNRCTYNISNKPEVGSESILSTFEGETKQLVAVGLHAEYSYARSLARFAATLGPIAWKVASKRIKQILPQGCRFGLGWIEEYEPLPTPVLLSENRNRKESGLFPPSFLASESRNNDKLFKIPFRTDENRVDGPVTEVKQSLLNPARKDTSGGKPPLFGHGGINHSLPLNAANQQQNLQSKKMKNQFELNLLPSPCQNDADPVTEKQFPDSNGVATRGLSNGKFVSDCLKIHRVIVSSDSLPNQRARVEECFSHGQDQGLTHPVQLNAQMQQKYSNLAQVEAPPATAVELNSNSKNKSNNASMAAARAWMSVGAGDFRKNSENSSLPNNQIYADSLCNSAREFNPQITRVHRFNSPYPVHWQGLGLHSQPWQKQEMLPPDLNISFQSSNSPVRQSLAVHLDSQQPDLALQL